MKLGFPGAISASVGPISASHRLKKSTWRGAILRFKHFFAFDMGYQRQITLDVNLEYTDAVYCILFKSGAAVTFSSRGSNSTV